MITKRPKRNPLKKRITELTVKRAKPQADHVVNTWDTKQSNLLLRTQPTGHKTWVVVYPRQGRSRWLTLGPAGDGAIPLDEARTMAAEAMLKVYKGLDPAADKRAERSKGTFAELHQRYLTEHAKKHNKSWKQADALIRRHVIPKLGKLSAAGITRDDVKTMLGKIGAPISQNQTLASLSAVFTWGVKEGIVPANPCKLITRNPTQDRDRVLSASEIALVWQAFDSLDPVHAAALKTVLLTGQRPGEVSNMRREHIKDGWWELPGAPIPGIWPGTKNKQSHRVALSEPVCRILKVYEALDGGTGYVFAGQNGKAVRDLDDDMRAITAKLGIDKVTPHDLRRTHGSTITSLGFGRQAMDRILNHADRSTGSIYDRYGYEQQDQHIMEAVAARIMALVEGREDADNVARPQFGKTAS